MGKHEPTVADLVVLSLLAERPSHGYELNQELERRDVRDWAGISRPQVYYSLKKAQAEGWIAPQADGATAAGPERQVYALTAAGHEALAAALARPDWATQRPAPPFLTWLALSAHCRPEAAAQVVAQRRAFLEAELARERATLAALRQMGGANVAVGILMVDLTVRHFEVELAWLAQVAQTLEGQAPLPPG